MLVETPMNPVATPFCIDSAPYGKITAEDITAFTSSEITMNTV